MFSRNYYRGVKTDIVKYLNQRFDVLVTPSIIIVTKEIFKMDEIEILKFKI